MSTNPTELSKYEVCKTLGQGSYGKALLVKLRPSSKGKGGTFFVMKEVSSGLVRCGEKMLFGVGVGAGAGGNVPC